MGVTVRTKGGPQLQARLRALSQIGQPISEAWGTETIRAMSRTVPVRTGATRRSFRVASASSEGATITGNKAAIFVDQGTRDHTIVPNRAETLAFKLGGRTVFSKRVSHPGGKPTHFIQRAGSEGLRRTDMADIAIRKWNGAA